MRGLQIIAQDMSNVLPTVRRRGPGSSLYLPLAAQLPEGLRASVCPLARGLRQGQLGENRFADTECGACLGTLQMWSEGSQTLGPSLPTTPGTLARKKLSVTLGQKEMKTGGAPWEP